MAIKDRLKYRRNELEMTLEDVAQIVGVTRATIQKYENGIISNIPSDKIELLAKALQVSPSYLMGWDEAVIDGIREDSVSGRMAARDEMFRLFGVEHSAASLRLFGEKIAVLYYKALNRHSAPELLDMIAAVDELDHAELSNIRAVVRAYLRADTPNREIVDIALKPYKQDDSLDALIG